MQATTLCSGISTHSETQLDHYLNVLSKALYCMTKKNNKATLETKNGQQKKDKNIMHSKAVRASESIAVNVNTVS